jgi:hypothetical protein
LAERQHRRHGKKRSPSPHRGEGRGEGVRAVALNEVSLKIGQQSLTYVGIIGEPWAIELYWR